MFTGETMDCVSCGFSQNSDPSIESGWAVLVVENQKKYICPTCISSPYPTSTPRCKTCNKYYESHYNSCPHCLKDKAVEQFKTQMMTVIQEADDIKKTPVFEIPEDFLNEALVALKDLKPKFEERGLFPVIKLSEDSTMVNGFTDLVVQNFVLSKRIAERENTTQRQVLSIAIAISKKLIEKASPTDLSAIFYEYKTIVDVIRNTEEKVSQDNN